MLVLVIFSLWLSSYTAGVDGTQFLKRWTLCLKWKAVDSHRYRGSEPGRILPQFLPPVLDVCLFNTALHILNECITLANTCNVGSNNVVYYGLISKWLPEINVNVAMHGCRVKQRQTCSNPSWGVIGVNMSIILDRNHGTVKRSSGDFGSFFLLFYPFTADFHLHLAVPYRRYSQ